MTLKHKQIALLQHHQNGHGSHYNTVPNPTTPRHVNHPPTGGAAILAQELEAMFLRDSDSSLKSHQQGSQATGGVDLEEDCSVPEGVSSVLSEVFKDDDFSERTTSRRNLASSGIASNSR